MAPVNHKVVVYGYDRMEEHEDLTDTTVVSGDLVERVPGDDGAARVQPHSGGRVSPFYVAMDKRRAGGELGYEWGAGELVYYRRLHGGEVHLRLAAGENVAPGDKLVSSGDGLVSAAATDGTQDNEVVGEAVEGDDNSGGDGPVYIPVRPAL